MGKARTAIIQSRREMSFFSCLSCSWLSFPLVRRLERSVNTQIPKKTAWITCTETGTHLQQWKHQTLARSRGRCRHRWGIAPQNSVRSGEVTSVTSRWVEFVHVKHKGPLCFQAGSYLGKYSIHLNQFSNCLSKRFTFWAHWNKHSDQDASAGKIH